MEDICEEINECDYRFCINDIHARHSLCNKNSLAVLKHVQSML